MYNKDAKMKFRPIGETPANVGPSTYIVSGCYQMRKNVTPFLSNTKRGFAIGRKQWTSATYDTELPFKRIKGGIFPKAKRFKTKLVDDGPPGPGYYNIKYPPKKCPKLDTTPIPGKGRLYMCRPPFSFNGKSCPSIPTKIDENGYDLDECGQPVKIPPDEFDTSIGPAYYHVCTLPCWTTRRYKGCQWSKSKSKRDFYKMELTPGPGQYELENCVCSKTERDEYVREMARLFSFIPRYTEAQELKTISEDMPGPGTYNLPSCLKCKRSLSIKPVPLVSGSKRFKTLEEEGPGPSTYEPCYCYKNKKSFSMKCIPFNVDSCRFSYRKTQAMPGPGDYEVPSPLMEKLASKINCYSTVNVPFCQTAERKMTFVKDDAYCTPGPANYPEPKYEDDEDKKMPIHHCVFKNGVERFKAIKRSDEADPATYNITRHFNRLKNRTSHSRGSAPFLAKAEKPPVFGKVKRTPCPTKYTSQGELADKGLYFNTDFPRFPCIKEDMPGPCTYKIKPFVQDSCYKALVTHNVKLQEEVHNRLNTRPKEKSWEKDVRKRKILRWFTKPSVDYRHCVFVM